MDDFMDRFTSVSVVQSAVANKPVFVIEREGVPTIETTVKTEDGCYVYTFVHRTKITRIK